MTKGDPAISAQSSLALVMMAESSASSVIGASLKRGLPNWQRALCKKSRNSPLARKIGGVSNSGWAAWRIPKQPTAADYSDEATKQRSNPDEAAEIESKNQHGRDQAEHQQ